MNARRAWSSPDIHDGVPDDERPTARMELTEYRKRVARMFAETERRSSGLFHAFRELKHGSDSR